MSAPLPFAAFAESTRPGASPWLGVLILGAVALAAVVAFVVECFRRPWVDCRRCGGSGKSRGGIFNPSAFRRCGRCRGSGQRVRGGRQVLDWFRDANERAK